MSIEFEHPRFFPRHIPHADWQEFSAEGYRQPVTGVVYRGEPRPTCGMPVGGLDTGCLDIEPNGMLGYVHDLQRTGGAARPCQHAVHGVPDGGTDARAGDRSPGQGGHAHAGRIAAPVPAHGLHAPATGNWTCPGWHSAAAWTTGDIIRSSTWSSTRVTASKSVVRAFHPFLPGVRDASLLPGAVFQHPAAQSGGRRMPGSVPVFTARVRRQVRGRGAGSSA